MTENHLKYDLHLGNLQFKQAWRSPSRRWQMILRSFLATRKFLYPNRIWLALPTTYPRPIGNPGKKGMSEKSWRGNQIKKRAGVRASQAILFIFHVFLSPLSCVHSFSFFLFFSKKAETLLTGKKKKHVSFIKYFWIHTKSVQDPVFKTTNIFIVFRGFVDRPCVFQSGSSYLGWEDFGSLHEHIWWLAVLSRGELYLTVR